MGSSSTATTGRASRRAPVDKHDERRNQLAGLSGRPTAMDAAAAYGALDGLFQQALLGYLTGDPERTRETLTGQVHGLMPLTRASR